ncbi:hypothetical protein TNCV_4106561 [Trichonephila clavipes]|nr:hypothetical protein TNCV_4106561 [Trichonephila clavipes]
MISIPSAKVNDCIDLESVPKAPGKFFLVGYADWRAGASGRKVGGESKLRNETGVCLLRVIIDLGSRSTQRSRLNLRRAKKKKKRKEKDQFLEQRYAIQYFVSNSVKTGRRYSKCP